MDSINKANDIDRSVIWICNNVKIYIIENMNLSKKGLKILLKKKKRKNLKCEIFD